MPENESIETLSLKYEHIEKEMVQGFDNFSAKFEEQNRHNDGKFKSLEESIIDMGNSLKREIVALSGRFNESRKPNFGLWVSIAGLCFTISTTFVVGLWTVGVLLATMKFGYVEEQISAIKQHNIEHAKSYGHPKLLTEFRENKATTKENMKEVETQMCGMSHAMNQSHHNIYEMLNVLRKKADPNAPDLRPPYDVVYGSCERRLSD